MLGTVNTANLWAERYKNRPKCAKGAEVCSEPLVRAEAEIARTRMRDDLRPDTYTDIENVNDTCAEHGKKRIRKQQQNGHFSLV